MEKRLNIHSAYARLDGLQRDDAQRLVVDKLADLQQRLTQAENNRSSWLKRLQGKRSRAPVRGFYLWGEVGRGKTFLMDLFFSTLGTERKRRNHFHRLMSDVHHRLKSQQNVEDPLDSVAESIADGVSVLCFDEFFVKDIGDAMILSRLLDGLFKRGVTLVATSNIAPQDLYRDGLQRSRFLPAIALLEQHMEVLELDAGPDYRLRALREAGTFLESGKADSQDRLMQFMTRVAPQPIETETALHVLGRPIDARASAEGIVWFEFPALCEGPRSQEDYIHIARCYQTVIVSDVPILTPQDEDAARRFIALVDEFYDRRVKLVMSAAAPINELYQGTRLALEFKRTASRLFEMQSGEYLHAPHLA